MAPGKRGLRRGADRGGLPTPAAALETGLLDHREGRETRRIEREGSHFVWVRLGDTLAPFFLRLEPGCRPNEPCSQPLGSLAFYSFLVFRGKFHLNH